MGIGPSTKETTLHHFRDPLIDAVSNDSDFDLVGIIVAGTPQVNDDKVFVGERIGAWVEAMRVDGVIVSIDGWGNSNIDFVSVLDSIGDRDIPVVGLSFIGTQAEFVISSKYLNKKTVLDFNKSKQGIETNVVGENNIEPIDAKKALAFLKLKIKIKQQNK